MHEDTPDRYHVVQTIQTMPGARTMELDRATHRLYTVSAQFRNPEPPPPGRRFRRQPIVPGMFALLVVGHGAEERSLRGDSGLEYRAGRAVSTRTAARRIEPGVMSMPRAPTSVP